MKDAHGLEYAEVVAIQATHLANWQPRIEPALFAAVKSYVLATNAPATTPDAKHQVYRGQSIVHLLQSWPDIGPAFLPVPQTSVLDCL